MNTHTFFIFAKLQMNYKVSFNKVVIKHFCKLSFKDFRN